MITIKHARLGEVDGRGGGNVMSRQGDGCYGRETKMGGEGGGQC